MYFFNIDFNQPGLSNENSFLYIIGVMLAIAILIKIFHKVYKFKIASIKGSIDCGRFYFTMIKFFNLLLSV